MRGDDIRLLICAAGLALLSCGQALPQQMPPSGGASMHTIHRPYDVETYGVFRNIMLSGEFGAKVQLAAVMARHPSTGVGAVADGRGEITIFDGKLIVSYGKPGSSPDANSEAAALLATASASEWQSGE